MATDVHLAPELKRFTRDCVEGGRYNNVSEVVLPSPVAAGCGRKAAWFSPYAR